MCDVMVALHDASREGHVLFGKNSDRPAGETQVLHAAAARAGDRESELQASHVRVPDFGTTLATIGTRPYWSWGYETGLNEAGVVGGNAAIFTRNLYRPKNRRQLGLTGMELLRLGLERGETAEATADIITRLLEQYGQWGSAIRGAEHDKGSYENSFLLADSREAWIVETSGRGWATERIERGYRSISNELTIRDKPTRCSQTLLEEARSEGWWEADRPDFDFAYSLGAHEHYSRQVSHLRLKRSQSLLGLGAPRLDPRSLMEILRDHYDETFLGGPQFSPFLPDFQTICMHDSPAGFTWGDTATSLVVDLDPSGKQPPTIWFAYLPPCSTLFFPWVPFVGDGLPESVGRAGRTGLQVAKPETIEADRFDEDSLWWRLHRLIRFIGEDPEARQSRVRALFDPIESDLLRKSGKGHSPTEISPTEINALTASALERVGQILEEFEQEWGH